MEMKLQGLFSVSSEEELMKSIRDCTPDITRLTQLAAHRLNVGHMTPQNRSHDSAA